MRVAKPQSGDVVGVRMVMYALSEDRKKKKTRASYIRISGSRGAVSRRRARTSGPGRVA